VAPRNTTKRLERQCLERVALSKKQKKKQEPTEGAAGGRGGGVCELGVGHMGEGNWNPGSNLKNFRRKEQGKKEESGHAA